MIATLKTWLRPGNYHWSALELGLARLGVALLIFFLGCQWHLKPFEQDPEKLNGFAKFVPLMWMLEPSVLLTLRIVTGITLVVFVIGWVPVLTLLPGLLALLGTGALRNSKGDISHSTQVLAMAALAMWGCYLFAALQRREWLRVGLTGQRAAMFAIVMVLAASYVSSGLIKMKATGGRWIARIPNMPVQMVKSNLSDYYTDPQGEVSALMTERAPLFFTQNPLLAKAVFGSGLLLELGAFTLLLGRRWALLWGGALLGMHLGISWLMDIEFWNHMGLLAVSCVFPGIMGLRKGDA